MQLEGISRESTSGSGSSNNNNSVTSETSMNSIWNTMKGSPKGDEYMADGTITLGEMYDFMSNNAVYDISDDVFEEATGFSRNELKQIAEVSNEYLKCNSDDDTSNDKNWDNIWDDIQEEYGITRDLSKSYFAEGESYYSNGGFKQKNETDLSSSFDIFKPVDFTLDSKKEEVEGIDDPHDIGFGYA